MKLPRLPFLRERAAMREFERQDPSFRELVFYSEGSADWPHLGPIIEVLLRAHGRKVSYLTSDPADPGLHVDDDRFRAFHIGAGTARTVLFARIRCRHFVMTLPDLGNLWLKRSVHPVHYVYVFHSVNSTHTAYRKGAFDAFDTILCVGPHHVEEIRKMESIHGLPAKELVEHGSTKLDTVLAAFADAPVRTRGSTPEVLVAPSWGESSLIERPVGRELIATLVRAGHRTVLRLHPMTVRRLPALVAELERLSQNEPLLQLEEDMNAIESWLRSDLMISDWSGAAMEYAFALGRPVIFIDTPQKIVNPEWRNVGTPALERVIREEIGVVVPPSAVPTIPVVVTKCLQSTESSRQRIAAVRSRWIFNPGRSSEVAARYLAGLAAA